MKFDVRVLIWDFDGTFYQPNEVLWQAVREAEYRVIENHTGWMRDKVLAEFTKCYKHVTPSATETVALLSNISIAEAALEMEQYYDRRLYVTKDDRLVALLKKLTRFRHFILANGVRYRLEETLVKFGVAKEIFEEIVTAETVGITKPDPAGFQYILDYTKLPPKQHLMIGDREEVDLVPAKKLGMRTCLVWAEGTEPSRSADVTLPNVYNVAAILS